MIQYMLTVYGTPGKFNGYSQMFKDSKKAGKAFAKTIAAGVESSLTQYIGNVAEWDIKTRGKAMKSDPAYMVLELMDTEEHANNYCSALREVLAAFPEIDRDELETELDRFI